MPPLVSVQQQTVLGLSLLVFAIAALILAGVFAALAYIVWRFREREEGRPARFTGDVRLEVAWTLEPLVTLGVVFVLMIGTMQSLTAPPHDPVRVRVVGHQWWWEFEVEGARTANELHLPVGRPTQLEISSADVIHSFWVPDLGGKRDAVPGQVQHLTLTPTREGTYAGACAEFCGVQHAWMRLRVVVEPPDAFAAWAARQRTNAEAPTTSDARRGESLFLGMTCVSCHAIRGTTAAGTAGPDLTHLASRARIGGEVAPNDDAHVLEWVRDPQRIKPGALMPAFRLSDGELSALVAYLRGLR